jgi:hypothetical protein
MTPLKPLQGSAGFVIVTDVLIQGILSRFERLPVSFELDEAEAYEKGAPVIFTQFMWDTNSCKRSKQL